MPRWLVVVILGLAGIAVGLAYGWLVNPVKFLDTTPASLRADFRADYVLMVAETFHARQDPQLAARQLAVFGAASPAAVCAQALQTAQSTTYSQADIGLLLELSRAMQALPPASGSSGGTP